MHSSVLADEYPDWSWIEPYIAFDIDLTPLGTDWYHIAQLVAVEN